MVPEQSDGATTEPEGSVEPCVSMSNLFRPQLVVPSLLLVVPCDTRNVAFISRKAQYTSLHLLSS